MILGIAAAAGFFLYQFNADLPDHDRLAKYEPPVMTRVHAANGQLVAEYARERRLYLPIQAVPDLVKAAFLSAEDKNFYEHDGLDAMGIARAWRVNLRNSGPASGRCGRLDHHAAGGEEFPAHRTSVTIRAQGQGGAPGAPHRAGLLEGQDFRALPERDLSRPRLLRDRRCGAQLLRQAGQPADDRGGRLSRGASEGAGELQSVPQLRARGRATQLGDRPAWWRTATSAPPTERPPRPRRWR